MKMRIDILIGLQRGDEAKGKIAKVLNDKNNYSAIIKYNGSGNAGHAVWIDDEKYTAHYLTSGIYDKDTKVVIGPGCVLNVEEFLKEFNEFDNKFKLEGRTFIHPYTHIITDDHIETDKRESKIGTTNKGNGPCYSDKYKRIGIRAEEVKELEKFILPEKTVKNIFNLIPNFIVDQQGDILMEGSQGWWLDIDHGDYPYVTSSHIHPAFAFASFGIPIQKLGNVYGVCKIYETYVGNATGLIQSSDEDAEKIRKVGDEYGETTGRPRDIGYLDVQKLIDAVNHNGVTTLYINKVDVLEDVKIFKLIDVDDQIKQFDTLEDMKETIIDNLMMYTEIYREKIIFSGKKDGTDI
jgi:adenylosuccinate synthase